MSKLDRIKELQSTINILSESLNDLQNKEKEIDKTIKTNCNEEVLNQEFDIQDVKKRLLSLFE